VSFEQELFELITTAIFMGLFQDKNKNDIWRQQTEIDPRQCRFLPSLCIRCNNLLESKWWPHYICHGNNCCPRIITKLGARIRRFQDVLQAQQCQCQLLHEIPRIDHFLHPYVTLHLEASSLESMLSPSRDDVWYPLKEHTAHVHTEPYVLLHPIGGYPFQGAQWRELIWPFTGFL
jgi:hypothetical protein